MSPECRAVHAGTKSAEAEVLVSMWMNAPIAAFHDAGVLMEMSQYAERNSLSCDAKQLQVIRVAAIQLRLGSVRTIVRRRLLG